MHELIFNTEKGAVYKIKERDLYQVEFGNAILMFSAATFKPFKEFVCTADEEKLNELTTGPPNKVVLYPNEFPGGYGFTRNEFMELKDLLHGASSLLGMKNELHEILNTIS